jgi:hypothetical protein
VGSSLFGDFASELHLVWSPRLFRARAIARRARDVLAQAIAW